MADVDTFQQKFVAFWQEIPDAKLKVEEIDSAIARHEEAIKALQLQRESVLEKESIMQKGASLAIQKFKESQVFERAMATLVENGIALDGKLDEYKGKLNKLKSDFVI